MTGRRTGTELDTLGPTLSVTTEPADPAGGDAVTATAVDDAKYVLAIAGDLTVPSASGPGDAGVVASAVNLDYPGTTVQAIFDHFTVEAT